jgi:hypothetical protein
MFMNFNRNFARKQILMLSVILFLVTFYFVNYMKPKCIYNINGSIRQFGIGYKNKTIFPIWIMAICLAIICHLIVILLSFPLHIFK